MHIHHYTGALRVLHWSLTTFWMECKVLVLICKSLNGLSPGYLRLPLSSYDFSAVAISRDVKPFVRHLKGKGLWQVTENTFDSGTWSPPHSLVHQNPNLISRHLARLIHFLCFYRRDLRWLLVGSCYSWWLPNWSCMWIDCAIKWACWKVPWAAESFVQSVFNFCCLSNIHIGA